jgi:hypothetical protein
LHRRLPRPNRGMSPGPSLHSVHSGLLRSRMPSPTTHYASNRAAPPSNPLAPIGYANSLTTSLPPARRSSHADTWNPGKEVHANIDAGVAASRSARAFRR